MCVAGLPAILSRIVEDEAVVVVDAVVEVVVEVEVEAEVVVGVVVVVGYRGASDDISRSFSVSERAFH